MDNQTNGGARIVDCDTHFFQPFEIWESYIAPRHKDAVLAYMNNDLNTMIRTAMAPLVAAHKGGDDPTARLKWMDDEGVYACVIYPGAGFVSYLPEPDAAAAGCRALNQWAADFASYAPRRLQPCITLPFQHPDKALEEFRYAREELGLKAVFSPPTPASDRRWSDPAFDPLWEAMQATGAIMTFHEFSTTPSQYSVTRKSYQDFLPMKYLCGHTVEPQLCIMDLILGGALERFPGLKVGLVEAHVAWLPGWLSLMDSLLPKFDQYFKTSPGVVALGLTPTEFFRRQCFIVAFPDDVGVDALIDAVGPDSVTICTDYPHPQARFGLIETFDRHQGALPPAARRKILSDNAFRIFGLE